jgi:hypothetical protein
MATVINSVTIAPDCKKLTVIASGVPATVNFTYYNYITEKTTTSGVLTAVAGDVTWILSSQVAGELFNGVISITDTVDILKPTVYTIGAAEIYCCIAALVQSAIDCHCHCDRCDEDLRKAEKIDLLIKSAQHATFSDTNITDAINKYNKAKDFCTETCACGC